MCPTPAPGVGAARRGPAELGKEDGCSPTVGRAGGQGQAETWDTDRGPLLAEALLETNECHRGPSHTPEIQADWFTGRKMRSRTPGVSI